MHNFSWTRLALSIALIGSSSFAAKNKYFYREHFVTAGIYTVHLSETYSQNSNRRHPDRAVMLMSGPVTVGSSWNLPVDGYNAGTLLADRGFYVYAVDFVGFGQSSIPAHGALVTPQFLVAPMQQVLEYIRSDSHADKVDIVSESIGGDICTQLAADATRVRSCVISTVLYRQMSPVASAILQSPDWLATLLAAPGGYFTTDSQYYLQFTTASPPAVATALEATQPGSYPVGPFLTLFNALPFFDPSVARAPGLILVGQFDFVPAVGDVQALAHDYGPSGATLIVMPGAGHTPRLESATTSQAYWAAVLNFIDPI